MSRDISIPVSKILKFDIKFPDRCVYCEGPHELDLPLSIPKDKNQVLPSFIKVPYCLKCGRLYDKNKTIIFIPAIIVIIGMLVLMGIILWWLVKEETWIFSTSLQYSVIFGFAGGLFFLGIPLARLVSIIGQKVLANWDSSIGDTHVGGLLGLNCKPLLGNGYIFSFSNDIIANEFGRLNM